jgi:hypothetical protein
MADESILPPESVVDLVFLPILINISLMAVTFMVLAATLKLLGASPTLQAAVGATSGVLVVLGTLLSRMRTAIVSLLNSHVTINLNGQTE